jgi:N-methylhydantoinase B/oxoprolinase/acetone carboxylase alpha subunit
LLPPGSGGFGPPAERAPAAIGRDLLDGYVSEAGATRDYGVADPDNLRRTAGAEDDA